MKKLISCFIAATAIISANTFAFAVQTDSKVIFKADDIDENQCFNVEMSIYNSEFNAFQFVLYYDNSVVVPVDENGRETDKFWKFAEKLDTGWMSTVGTGIDENLIDFTGYVTPGESVAVDNEPETGKAIIGETGLKLFDFNFKKISDKPVKFAIASQNSGLPYREYLPEGFGVADAGIAANVTVEFIYPNNIGENDSINSDDTNNNQSVQTKPEQSENTSDNEEKPTDNKNDVSVDELLAHSILLKIDSHAAVSKGGVTSIYAGEKNVTAYIKNNRTYVPIRFIAEKMGANVDWDNQTQTVTIKKDSKTIKMTIGSANYTVDGQTFTTDATAELKDSRTRVPIRFIADALGYQVEWDSVHNMVIIGDNIVKWDLSSQVANDTLDKADNLLIMYSSFV